MGHWRCRVAAGHNHLSAGLCVCLVVTQHQFHLRLSDFNMPIERHSPWRYEASSGVNVTAVQTNVPRVGEYNNKNNHNLQFIRAKRYSDIFRCAYLTLTRLVRVVDAVVLWVHIYDGENGQLMESDGTVAT